MMLLYQYMQAGLCVITVYFERPVTMYFENNRSVKIGSQI
jgi:hypothetical protein